MKRLVSETVTCTKVYTYMIANKFTEKEEGGASITFINGKFDSAIFPFKGPYNKAQWEILEAMNKKIEELSLKEAK